MVDWRVNVMESPWKKILMGGFVVLVVMLTVYRERLFVRDPVARVERNGIQESDVRVYVNSYNDILVEYPEADRRYLVQSIHGVPGVPGVPVHLGCLRGLACLTERDHAPVVPLAGSGYEPEVVMTSAYVSFDDGAGAPVRVELHRR